MPGFRYAPPSRVLLCVLAVVLLLPVAEWLRPRQRLAAQGESIQLEQQVPIQFGNWAVDRTVQPILPSPDVQARLDVIYTQVLARTYVNSRGERVMLSIAYGSDQGSEATAVHRPEFCYSAQGFKVDDIGSGFTELADRRVPTRWLLAVQAGRIEPISYWVTLDRTATLPGLGRKLAQLRYGLRGQIPDGMLVRISSISSDTEAALRLHRDFALQLEEAMAPGLRARYFGQ